MKGKNGLDITFQVPQGTIITKLDELYTKT